MPRPMMIAYLYPTRSIRKTESIEASAQATNHTDSIKVVSV